MGSRVALFIVGALGPSPVLSLQVGWADARTQNWNAVILDIEVHLRNHSFYRPRLCGIAGNHRAKNKTDGTLEMAVSTDNDVVPDRHGNSKLRGFCDESQPDFITL
jgi:hypothetical protein